MTRRPRFDRSAIPPDEIIAVETCASIAAILGVSKSTIHRDMQRPAEIPDGKSRPRFALNARGQIRPSRYRPRTTTATLLCATVWPDDGTPHQVVRATTWSVTRPDGVRWRFCSLRCLGAGVDAIEALEAGQAADGGAR